MMREKVAKQENAREGEEKREEGEEGETEEGERRKENLTGIYI